MIMDTIIRNVQICCSKANVILPWRKKNLLFSLPFFLLPLIFNLSGHCVGINNNNINMNAHLPFLTVHSSGNYEKQRLGGNADGGYVITILPNVAYDCYISAGVGMDEQFSGKFVETYGMHEFNSYAFDGTVNAYPHEYTTNISFVKKNIASYNDNHHTDLSFLLDTYHSIFLKMDIEGSEYDWIMGVRDENMNHFAQIVMEVHGVNDDSWGYSYEGKVKCFEKLSKTHVLVHAHGNNNSGTQHNIPEVLELCYVHKKFFSQCPDLNTDPLPSPTLDSPNNELYPDHDMNFPPFVHT